MTRLPWLMALAALAISVLSVSTGCAGGEADLLKKFQQQNHAAAEKLRHEATRLLAPGKAGQASDMDLSAIQRLLDQLREDVTLPREERASLARRLQERARDGRIALGDGGVSKIQVKSSVIVVTNQGTIRVPDGGVAVLGSTKYVSEGRNEGGVPIVGGVPYLGRLYRNVGAGRSIGGTQISISARIIRMEEEEARFLNGK